MAENVEARVFSPPQNAAAPFGRKVSLLHAASGSDLTAQKPHIKARAMGGLPILNFSV
jgi:hypothetical protein